MCDNENGWVKDEDTGAWYYYSDGEVTTGWKYIDGDRYYFNHPGGSMGWSKEVDGYYLGYDGKVVTNEGWVNTDKNNYGTWYYVGSHGKVVTGWNKIGDDFHYFNYPGGSMTWKNTIDGFYIDNDGKIVSGTGWLKDEYSGEWYYFSDGEMKTGWIKDGDNWYYLNDDGSMATGWKYIDGDWYYLHSDGSMATGWVKDDSGWYFLYNNGTMAHDYTADDGYHVDKSGKMITGRGWVSSDGSWYYLKDDGSVATKWLQDQGNWYYLYPQGSMAHEVTIDGWYVDNNGKWDHNRSGNWVDGNSDTDKDEGAVKYDGVGNAVNWIDDKLKKDYDNVVGTLSDPKRRDDSLNSLNCIGDMGIIIKGGTKAAEEGGEIISKLSGEAEATEAAGNAVNKINGKVSSYIKGGSKAIDPSKLGDVWKLGATERGDVIEEILASTEYKDWYNIGSSRGGYFEAIDFQKGNQVVSLKSIDPTLPSYSGSGATNKVIDYLNDLDKEIKVDGNIANKILDVRIPEGTQSNFDLDFLLKEAKRRGIKLIIKEFK